MTQMNPYDGKRILETAALGTRLVRTKLAGATDAQLSFVGLKTKDRDALLERPVTLFLHNHPADPEEGGVAAMHYHRISNKKDGTFISYSLPLLSAAGIPTDPIIGLSAHENFHAAKHAGGTSYHDKKDIKPIVEGAVGITLTGLGFLLHKPWLAVPSLALVAQSCVRYASSSARYLKQEELGAFKFETIFSLSAFDSNRFDLSLEKDEPEPSLRTGYPTEREQAAVINATRNALLHVDKSLLFFQNAADYRNALRNEFQANQNDPMIRLEYDSDSLVRRVCGQRPRSE